VGQAPIAANGDSARDLQMLQRAEISYMPANRLRALRVLSDSRNYRTLRKPLQSGLLAAVADLIHDHSGSGNGSDVQQAVVQSSSQFIGTVLCVTDNSAISATARWIARERLETIRRTTSRTRFF